MKRSGKRYQSPLKVPRQPTRWHKQTLNRINLTRGELVLIIVATLALLLVLIK